MALVEAEHRLDSARAEALGLHDRLAYLRGRMSATVVEDERLALEADLQVLENALTAARAVEETAAQRAHRARAVAAQAHYFGGVATRGLHAPTDDKLLVADARKMRDELSYIVKRIAVMTQLNTEEE